MGREVILICDRCGNKKSELEQVKDIRDIRPRIVTNVLNRVTLTVGSLAYAKDVCDSCLKEMGIDVQPSPNASPAEQTKSFEEKVKEFAKMIIAEAQA